MNTEITNAVNAAGDKAQYDARVKRILAQKNILAHILVKTVDEFKGMKPEDVVTYIEGEPKVGNYAAMWFFSSSGQPLCRTCHYGGNAACRIFVDVG